MVKVDIVRAIQLGTELQFGEIITEHNFFPVNNFSFSDSSPLGPGSIKEFGFPIDDIVPGNWGGNINSYLINLKFK